MSDFEELLTTGEAAGILRVAPQTLRLWRARGTGPPYYRIGRGPAARVVYSRQDLERWLANRRVEPSGPRAA